MPGMGLEAGGGLWALGFGWNGELVGQGRCRWDSGLSVVVGTSLAGREDGVVEAYGCSLFLTTASSLRAARPQNERALSLLLNSCEPIVYSI